MQVFFEVLSRDDGNPNGLSDPRQYRNTAEEQHEKKYAELNFEYALIAAGILPWLKPLLKMRWRWQSRLGPRSDGSTSLLPDQSAARGFRATANEPQRSGRPQVITRTLGRPIVWDNPVKASSVTLPRR